MLTPRVTESHHMCPHVVSEALPKVSMPDRVRASLIAVPEPKPRP